jgi:hypothetical protein
MFGLKICHLFNTASSQAFYPVTANVTLTPGDFFVARCSYNTTTNPNPTFIGETL